VIRRGVNRGLVFLANACECRRGELVLGTVGGNVNPVEFTIRISGLAVP
jgi:hypothetical protein